MLDQYRLVVARKEAQKFRRKELFCVELLETSETFDFSPSVGGIPEFEIQITGGHRWRSTFLVNLQRRETKKKHLERFTLVVHVNVVDKRSARGVRS